MTDRRQPRREVWDLVKRSGRPLGDFFRFDQAGDQFDLVRWIIKLRWVTSAIALASIIPGVYLGFVDASNIGEYLLVMSMSPLFNCLLVYFNKPISHRLKIESQIMLGLIFDMQILFVLLAMTGGWNNPFSSMVFFYATLASMSVGPGRAIGFGLLLQTDIVLLQKVFRDEIPTSIDWSNAFADTIVECIVGVSLMSIVSFLVSRLIKQAQEVSQLRKARLRMDRLRAIGALSSGVCHELATPLNNVGMRLERLLRDASSDDEDAIENMFSMKRSLNKAHNALRRLADIQVDSDAASMETVDFGNFIDEAIKSWLKDPSRKALQVKCNDFPKVSVAIPVSSVMQVFLDILDNGAEAMEDRFTCLTVDVLCDSKFVWFSVTDEGPGFSKQALQYLGEPFNSEKPTGSGLGLYHAQLISHLLGGEFRGSKP